MSDIEELLRPIREAYWGELPGRLSTMRDQLLRGRAGDATAWVELRTAAHRLRGTAGSHDLPEVGAHLGRLDDTLSDALEPTDGGPADLRHLADALQAHLDAAVATFERRCAS